MRKERVKTLKVMKTLFNTHHYYQENHENPYPFSENENYNNYNQNIHDFHAQIKDVRERPLNLLGF